jgi:alanine racemase
VIVYGSGADGEASATDLAEIIGTIGEEIAVRVSPLVPRSYAAE